MATRRGIAPTTKLVSDRLPLFPFRLRVSTENSHLSASCSANCSTEFESFVAASLRACSVESASYSPLTPRQVGFAVLCCFRPAISRSSRRCELRVVKPISCRRFTTTSILRCVARCLRTQVKSSVTKCHHRTKVGTARRRGGSGKRIRRSGTVPGLIRC